MVRGEAGRKWSPMSWWRMPVRRRMRSKGGKTVNSRRKLNPRRQPSKQSRRSSSTSSCTMGRWIAGLTGSAKPKQQSSRSAPKSQRPRQFPQRSRPKRGSSGSGSRIRQHRSTGEQTGGQKSRHNGRRIITARRLFRLPKLDSKLNGKVIRAPRGTLGMHNTSESNLPSIVRKGLKLAQFKSTHNTQAIYFRPMDYAAITDTRFSGDITVVCDLTGLKMIPRFHSSGKVYEFAVLEDVGAGRILHSVHIGKY